MLPPSRELTITCSAQCAGDDFVQDVAAHRRQHADACASGCAHDSRSHLKRQPGLDGQTGSGAEVVI